MAKRELQIAPAKRKRFLSLLLYFVVLLFSSLKESEAAQAVGEKVDQTKQKKTDKCLMRHCWSAEIQRRYELVKK